MKKQYQYLQERFRRQQYRVFKTVNLILKMFFILLAFICGIVSAQELPSIPRLRPRLVELYKKISGSESGEGGSNSETTTN
tara:strand:+ start:994 stop:1236 length:243 start_codon:yes stop_codon:yes gene_type:complete